MPAIRERPNKRQRTYNWTEPGDYSQASVGAPEFPQPYEFPQPPTELLPAIKPLQDITGELPHYPTPSVVPESDLDYLADSLEAHQMHGPWRPFDTNRAESIWQIDELALVWCPQHKKFVHIFTFELELKAQIPEYAIRDGFRLPFHCYAYNPDCVCPRRNHSKCWQQCYTNADREWSYRWIHATEDMGEIDDEEFLQSGG